MDPLTTMTLPPAGSHRTDVNSIRRVFWFRDPLTPRYQLTPGEPCRAIIPNYQVILYCNLDDAHWHCRPLDLIHIPPVGTLFPRHDSEARQESSGTSTVFPLRSPPPPRLFNRGVTSYTTNATSLREHRSGPNPVTLPDRGEVRWKV